MFLTPAGRNTVCLTDGTRRLAHMTTGAHIGPSIRITGEVTAEEPLTIAGQVKGKVLVKGHPLTVTEDARLDADISAHTIIVSGAVKGHLSADGRILVEQSAQVEGDVSTPSLRVIE